MNKWTKMSIELAYQHGYLDNLMEIYPVSKNPERTMNNSLKTQIINTYNKKVHKSLIQLLNDAVSTYKLKFPIDNYYISSLRNEPEWLEKNPALVKKIGELLLSYSKEELLTRCIAPKKESRQVGSMFDKWFKKKFSKDKLISFIGSTDAERKEQAHSIINYHGKEKGLDIFVKINGIFVFGEAKFITDAGGTQWNQFESALNIINTFDKKENTLPISIVDGHCWRKANDQFYNAIIKSVDNHIIISALLLEELFEKIKSISLPKGDIGSDKLIKLL